MIDLTAEHVFSLAEAARKIPGRAGKSLHFSTLFRWVTQGARSPSGQRIRLRAARCGGRWLTSAEAVSEFIEALTPNISMPDIRSPNQRKHAAQRAGDQLTKLGI